MSLESSVSPAVEPSGKITFASLALAYLSIMCLLLSLDDAIILPP